MSYDQVWVKHIKAALMENRFRLVQQPIASLQGEDPGMFDVLVRMIDSQGKEVLPSEFMAAAGAQRSAEEHRPLGGRRLAVVRGAEETRVPVRAAVAGDARATRSFVEWLDNHLRSSRAEPQRLCFQITEESAASLRPARFSALAAALRQRRFRFALEGFGSGRDSMGCSSRCRSTS